MGLEIDAAGIEQDALAHQRDVGRRPALPRPARGRASSDGRCRRCGPHCRARRRERRRHPGAAACLRVPAECSGDGGGPIRCSTADSRRHRACSAAAPSVPAPGWPARALAAMRSISSVGAANSSMRLQAPGDRARRLRNRGSAKLSVQAAVSSASYHSAASATGAADQKPIRAGLARRQFAQQLAGQGKALEGAGAGFDVSQLRQGLTAVGRARCCASQCRVCRRACMSSQRRALGQLAAGMRHLPGQL